jgi:hypothetical protein
VQTLLCKKEYFLVLGCGMICLYNCRHILNHRRLAMAKSNDKKKQSDKKTPLKSIKEKRAAKKAKKAEKT